MAEGDEDLVSQVRIEGADEAKRQLDDLGKAGEDAFNRIETASNKSGRGLSNQLTRLRAATKILENLRPAAGAIGSIEQLGASFNRLTTNVQQAARRFEIFATKTRRVALVATAVAGGLIALARSSAKAYDEAGKAQDANTDSQLRSLQANQQAAAAEFQHGRAVSQLRGEFARGDITFEQYNRSLQGINRQYRENQIQSAFAANQAEALRRETQRLQEVAARTKAFDELSNRFGTTLAGSMIAAGRAAGVFIGDIQRSLGPALAAVVDRVVVLFEQNRTAIVGFFDTVANKINQFVQSGGIEQSFSVIGKAIGVVASVITSVVIPAFNALIAISGVVANALNSIFGTELTGGALAAIVVLGTFTRSFQLLFSVLRAGQGVIGLFAFAIARIPLILGSIPIILSSLSLAFRLFLASLGPVGLAITAVTLAVGAFVAAGGDVIGIWNSVVAFIVSIPQRILSAWSNLETSTISIWRRMVDGVISLWNDAMEFFASLPELVTQFFVQMGDAIVSAFQSAVDRVTSIMSEILDAAKRFIQPVIDMLKQLGSLLGGVEGKAAGGAVGFKGGGFVRGPGTSTSDSIPAWLSDKEYVVKARAVAKYGRHFLDALNSGRLDLSRIGFSNGGLVSHALAPRLAEGGQVQASFGRPVILNLPGESFKVEASETESQKIIRYAVRKQTRSAGRKPTWVGR